MSRPRLLDLFCCEGGAAVGYHRAGFDVYGVDLFKHKNDKGRTVGFSQKRYPFPSHQGDAIDVMERLLDGRPVPFRTVGYLRLDDFDAIHASPPCQDYSRGTAAIRANGGLTGHKRLIAATRAALEATDTVWVIENVEDAKDELRDPLTLCGTEFGLTAVDGDGTPLEMWRHRLFESNAPLTGHGGCRHHAYSRQVAGAYGGARRDKVAARTIRKGGYVPRMPVIERLLGIDWMTQGGLFQSLPPVYMEHIGAQLLAHVEASEAAA